MPPSERPLTATEVAYLGFSARWHDSRRFAVDVSRDGAFVASFDVDRLDQPGVDYYARPVLLPEGVLTQLVMKLREGS